MVGVNFTAIQCEPYTAHEMQGKPYFAYCLCANVIVYNRFEDFRSFQYAFVSVVKIFLRTGKCTSRYTFFLRRNPDVCISGL